MDGYQISFDMAQKAASDLNKILEEFQKQIELLSQKEEELLNDSLWYGPNKSDFTQKFNDYKTKVSALHKNAVEHYTALNQILSAYQKAEE